MGLLTSKLGINALSMEDPAQPLLPYSALIESLGLGRTDAGVLVNEKQAMRITTVFACINVISSDLSSLSRSVYQKMPDGSVREATEHMYYPLLHDTPNATMTASVFWGAILSQALGWGNGYALIRRDRGARASSLVPLPSERTSPVWYQGRLMYGTTATVNGLATYMEPADVIHVPGLTMDGYVGLSPIQTCKNAFGLAMAAEKFGAQFFGNGARTSGVLSHPGQLDTEALENLKKSLREQLSNENALRPMVLEEGMSWTQASVNPNDAQFLETRQFQRSEIASLYRLPLHLLQDLTRSTNNNIEHQALDYIRYALRPWAIRVEQEVNKKLLGGTYYCEHDFNDFQRGDFASQTAGLLTLRNGGIFNANDARKVLRQNPIPDDEGGNVYLAPLNMVNLATLVNQETPTDDTAGGDPGEPITDLRRERVLATYRRLFRDAVGRVVNRKGADAQFVYRAFQPIVAAMSEAVWGMYLPSQMKLTDLQESRISEHLASYSPQSSSWTKQNAAESSTRLTGEAYDALHAALIG